MSIRYTAEQLQRKFAGPAGSPGYARVADAMRAEGRAEEAIELCREGLRSRPTVAGHVVLGKALVESDRLEEAREEFEAALRLDARCLYAMRALAGIMDKLQWADAAAGYYRSILDVEPWDAEIHALLEGGAPPTQSRAPEAAPAEEAFPKPDGFQGDVLEVNLNEMADEFLPSGGEASPEEPLSPAGFASPEMGIPPAEADVPEPAPQDILSSPLPSADSEGDASAPISGSDVEERLDSMFGNETGAVPSATATWTAAPAFPEIPPEASGTAAGEPRVFPDEIASASAAFPAADFVGAPPEETGDEAIGTAPETLPADPESAVAETDGQVRGEDIERRLDELFNLAETDVDPASSAIFSATDLPVAPGPAAGETVALGEVVPFGEAPSLPLGEDTRLSSEGEIVTGQDVADKLDSLLGPDPQAKSASAVDGAEASILPEEPAPAPAASAQALAPEPGFPAPDGGALMSTESMLPSGWQADAPQVTGADIEAQLDRLFDLEPSAAAEPPPSNVGDTAFPAEASGSDPAADASAALEAGLGETMFLPNGDMDLAVPEEPAPEVIEAEFGTFAPEDAAGISDTAAIEMVDGSDVADQLDRLFQPEPGETGAASASQATAEVPLTEASLAELDAGATLEVPVQSPIPEPMDIPAEADSPLPEETIAGAAPDAALARAPVEAGASAAPADAPPALAQMSDEEEGYPEEEEMPEQGAGANVATVTLAEIYFQQGLREQALQIYRQLLEREPGNESVRKRITEIEATRSDADAGAAADSRWPRPGLKVPKRKK